MFLGDIAEINIGVVLKRKEATYKSCISYNYKIFTIKSYEENLPYENFYSNEDLSLYTVKKGDLVFRLAYPLKVFEVDENLEGLLMNNQFCIIRLTEFKDKKYNSTFLKYFLESNDVSKQLEKFLMGTISKAIPVSKIRLIKIPQIDLKNQKQIADIYLKWEKQKDLYEKVLMEKEKYYNSVINKLIKGDK